ncbi:MAG TPA: hypothetical protein PLB02_15830, partial [Thermoanaerobaculia bacterium]|nr:hypothetical protein [Thermoanaerobaculia bacterium]
MRHANDASSRRVLLWVAIISGFLLLSFAAALRAGAEGLPGSASRRQDFTASGPIRSLSIEILNGSVEVVAGPAFSATVELTARAKSDAEARRALDGTQCRLVNENGELTLVTEPPGVRVRRTRDGGFSVRARETDGVRVEARCRVTLPAAAALDASVVSGPVSVRGMASELKVSTVNGRIEVTGARKGLKANTVNGSVEVSLAELPKGAEVELKAVSGNLLLRLPSAAAFSFNGRTMSGEIVSTFPFPPRGREDGPPDAEAVRVDRERILAEKAKVVAEKEKVRRSAGEGLPPEELADLERSMAEMSRELAHMGAEMARVTVLDLNRSYEGAIGCGGALVRMSNLSGRIVLLADGTAESQARPLLPARHARIVEMPQPPRPPRPV